MFLDGPQHRVGVWARDDDAGGTEVDVGGEKIVELSAVVERRRVHFDVLVRDRSGDDRADVVGHQTTTGMHHSLGARFGSAGVHHAYQLIVGYLDVRRDGGRGQPVCE